MVRKPTHGAAFPLTTLLQGVDRGLDDTGEVRPARKPTPKELEVFQKSNLAGRIRWLLLRRATDDGLILPEGFRKACQTKLERFKGARFLSGAPVGPGCAWLSVGPRNINGRIKSLAIHPTNGQILYAGAAEGGVWKTTDGGQSWTPKMHDEQSLAIGALAIDPNNPDTIYAGTGEPVYLFSGTGPLPPGSPTLAWYYEGVGVYKSTDGGNTWALTGAIENHFIYRIAVDPFNSSNVLCAGFSSAAGAGGLCRSTDGGTTWTTVTQGVFTDVLFDPNNSGRAYAGTYNGGVLKSTDSGQTWVARNTGLPATNQIGRVSLTLARANSNVLYAKIENDLTGGLLSVYRTASAAEPPGAPGGWTQVSNPPVRGKVWWDSFIAADPTDPNGNVVFAGGLDVARSGNGGTSWELLTNSSPGDNPISPPVPLQPTHPDQHALVFYPSNSNTVYVANDGGVFRGVYTGGAPPITWIKISTGLVVSQFYDLHVSSASRSMFGGGSQDNGSMISTGGQSWRHAFGGDGSYVAFHPTDPYVVYVQYYEPSLRRGMIYRSTDGGQSFTSAHSGISGESVMPAAMLVIDPVSPNTLFAGTDRVFRTTTGGVGTGAWTAVPGWPTTIGTDPNYVTEITLAPPPSAVVYAGSIKGRLYRADFASASPSFADITPGNVNFPTRWLSGITVRPSDANTIYVTFLGFNSPATGPSNHVWKGVFNPGPPVTWTWNSISSNLPNIPVSALVIDPATSNLYVATDVGVFRSTNDGASWQPFEAGLPNTAVVDLALDPVRNVLRAATHGRGMFQIVLSLGCPEVDIYLRDNIIDTGEVIPSPSGEPDPTRPGFRVYHWQSADIKVDAPPFDPLDALTDGVEFDDPEHRTMGVPFNYKIEDIAGIEHNNPIRGQTNRVYVQVHNRGGNKASSVTVKLLYADAGAGLPALPANFWTVFPADTFTQTNWKPIGTTTITDLLPNVPRVLRWDWVPPATTSDHVCLLAMIHSPQDSLLPQTELNVDILTPRNKRVTHKNVHPISLRSAQFAWAWLNFYNGFRKRKVFRFRVENISNVRSRLCMLLPRVKLQEPLKKSLTGFRAIKVRKDELKRYVAAAKQAGAISDYAAKVVAGFGEPLVLEVEPGRTAAELRGVSIPAGGKVPAVFSVPLPSVSPETWAFHFDVTQFEGDRLIGGSEFVTRRPRGS